MAPDILIISDDLGFRLNLRNELVQDRYNVYHCEYNTNIIDFLESDYKVHAVIFDFRKDTVEAFSFITVINSLLQKEHPDCMRIVCFNPTDMHFDYVQRIPSDHELVSFSAKEYSKSVKVIRALLDITPESNRITMRKRGARLMKQHDYWPLSDLPESKVAESKKVTINIDISQGGIEHFDITFNKPVTLPELLSLTELVPVAYLENHYHGTKIEKAKILGINRMKYTRLVDHLKNRANGKEIEILVSNV